MEKLRRVSPVASRRIGNGSSRPPHRFAIVLFIFGLLVPGVDNWAHLGGFAGGFVLGRVFNPMTPEKPDHTVAAAAILVTTLIAVGVSFVVGFG